ncbi:MAG: HD domain-containing phosphohydrolase [Rhodospirillaceae bacterium]
MAARIFRSPPQPRAVLASRASPGVAAGSYTTPWDASSSFDCRIVEFTESPAALSRCEAHDADLVLVDYIMPDLDGIEFVGRFRQLPGREHVPVVMVTSSDVREVRYRALGCGATDFLNKPLDKTELVARCRNMLTIRRSQLLLLDRAAWLAAEVQKATLEVLEREREVILRLSKAAEFRDPETGSHLVRMACYTRLIAVRLGLGMEMCDLLYSAAPMHDVGKVGIADHILLKPGRLTADEFAIMKRHAEIGHEILKGSPSALLRCAALIALTHHEKFNGSGYPRGLMAEECPIEGRIIAVADVFDALTSERVYKRAWPPDAARDFLIAHRGSHFDPACVDAFIGSWDEAMEVRRRHADPDYGFDISEPEPVY